MAAPDRVGAARRRRVPRRAPALRHGRLLRAAGRRARRATGRRGRPAVVVRHARHARLAMDVPLRRDARRGRAPPDDRAAHRARRARRHRPHGARSARPQPPHQARLRRGGGRAGRRRAAVRAYGLCYLELNAALGAGLGTDWPVAVDHGSITETSWVMAMEPDLVDLERLPEDPAATDLLAIYGPNPRGRASRDFGRAADRQLRGAPRRARLSPAGGRADRRDGGPARVRRALLAGAAGARRACRAGRRRRARPAQPGAGVALPDLARRPRSTAASPGPARDRARQPDTRARPACASRPPRSGRRTASTSAARSPPTSSSRSRSPPAATTSSSSSGLAGRHVDRPRRRGRLRMTRPPVP